MLSKTTIKKRLEKKGNPGTADLIRSSFNTKWFEVIGKISSPRRKRLEANLSELDKFAKEGEKILVLGKVLSQGNITKKIKVVAFSFSENAKEKIVASGNEFITIEEEIKKNKDMKDLRIFKK